MSIRHMRGALAALAVSAVAVAGLAFVAPTATAATGTLAIEPTSGTGTDLVSVLTSGGCADATATHFVVKLSGSGIQYTVPGTGSTGPTYESVNYMVGATSLAAVSSAGDSTSPIRVPLSKLFGSVKAENKDGILPSGAYTLALECRAKLSTTALSTFTTTVTIIDNASGLSFRQGAPTAIESLTAPKVSGRTASGAAKVGATLRVTNGTWSPTPASFTYEWKIGTKVVSTKSSYKVIAADRGKKVTIKVTAKADGYLDASKSTSILIAKK